MTFGMSGLRCSWLPLGGQLATTLVATISVIFFPLFFSPSSLFLIEGELESKNLFSKSCSERPITCSSTPFQTPSANLVPPGVHFGFCGRLYVTHRRSAQIKKPIQRKFFGAANNLHFKPLNLYILFLISCKYLYLYLF